MGEDKITYDDIKDYESLFTMAPSFLLEMFARKNKNLVLKFESVIRQNLANLNPEQKNKLEIILESDVEELQKVLHEAYVKSNKKQYKILANPQYKQFIELNLNEIRKMVK